MKALQRSATPVEATRFLPGVRHSTVVLVALLVATVLALAIALAAAGGSGDDGNPVRVAPSAPLPPSPAERDQPPGLWGPGMRP
jgi:hypothetical protein